MQKQIKQKGHNFASDLKPSLDWDILRVTPQTVVDGKTIIENDHVFLKRNDTLKTLYSTNATYTETTNGKFMDYANQLSKVSGCDLLGYSEFKEGEIVLAYLQGNEDFLQKYLGNDCKSTQYMVLGNSHDGTMPIFVGSSNILLRCTNAFSHIIPKAVFRHTKNHQAKMEDFLRLTERFKADMEIKAKNFAGLREIKIDAKILDMLANKLLSIDMDGGKVSPQQETKKSNLMESMNIELGDLGMNLFGFFNGVTHFTTHTQKTKTDTDLNLFGGNMKLNESALDLVYAFGKENGLVLAK